MTVNSDLVGDDGKIPIYRCKITKYRQEMKSFLGFNHLYLYVFIRINTYLSKMFIR